MSQLNAAKTEIAWFWSRANLNKISGSDLCLPVGSNVIKPREVVRDLGVYLESELSFKQHITKVANSCFHHFRRLCQIYHSIDEDVMIQLVVAFVLSRIDYCNSVLAALPWSTIEPLQHHHHHHHHRTSMAPFTKYSSANGALQYESTQKRLKHKNN